MNHVNIHHPKENPLEIIIVDNQRSKIFNQAEFKTSRSFSSKLTLFNNGFEYLPRNFLITTNNGKYYFNTDMLRTMSPIIDNQLEENPNHMEYFIDIDDDSNSMKKFEDIFKLQIVCIDKSDLAVLQKVVYALDLEHTPFFDNFSTTITNVQVRIDRKSFFDFLRQAELNTIKITSDGKVYNCNRIGVYSSQIISDILRENKDLTQFVLDVDREDGFSLLRDLFNYQTICIDANNVEFLEKACNDLQIACIRSELEQFNQLYSSAFDSVDAKQHIIESLNELFEILYNVETFTPQRVVLKLLETEWVSTEENIIEMASCIFQVIRTKLCFHPSLLDLIILLDKESNDTNKLGIFLPFFKKQILTIVHESPLYSAFLYRLFNRGLITFDSIMHQLEQNRDNKEKKKTIGDTLKCFIPEFHDYIKNNFTNLKISNSISQQFQNIELYKQMRANFEPINPLFRLILQDDVKELQKVISEQNVDISQTILPITIIDEDREFHNLYFSPTQYSRKDYQGVTLIEYAAEHASINCFKYLLLNQSPYSVNLILYALKGGNFEIIRSLHSNLIGNFPSTPGQPMPYEGLFLGFGLRIVIQNHLYSVCDWILDQFNDFTFMDLDKLVYLCAENGNIQSLLSLMNKDLDITKYFSKDKPRYFGVLLRKGFIHFVQLMLSFTKKSQINYYSFTDNPLYLTTSQNPLIFQFITNIPISDILYSAIELNRYYIVDYILTNIEYSTKKVDYYNLYYHSVQTGSCDMFKYITGKMPIESSKNYMVIPQYMEVISRAALHRNFEPVKELTEFVLKINNNTDFTIALINASQSHSPKICQFFVDKNVHLDFWQLSKEKSLFNTENGNIPLHIFQKADKVIQSKLFYPFIYQFALQNRKNNILTLLRMNLDDLSIQSFLREKSLNSPLVLAIRKLNLKAVDAFIEYFGEEITQLIGPINFGLQLVLEDFYNIDANITNNKLVESRLSDFIQHTIKNHKSDSPIKDSKECFAPIRKMIIRLLEVGIDIDLNRQYNSITFFSIALKFTDVEFIKLYLKHITDRSIFDEVSETSPFVLAIKSCNFDIINLFIEYLGQDISKQNAHINLGLQIIFREKCLNRLDCSSEVFVKIMSRLAEYADIDFTYTYDNQSFVLAAVSISDVEFVKFYLKHLKDRSIINEKSILSPFVYAIVAQKLDIIDVFLDYLADEISQHKEQVEYAFQLLIDSLTVKNYRILNVNLDNTGNHRSLIPILDKLTAAVNCEIKFGGQFEILLQLFIQDEAGIDFIKYYLYHIKDHSLLYQLSDTSPFVYAIMKFNLEAINLFIDYYGEDTKHRDEQIHFALTLLTKEIITHFGFKLQLKQLKKTLLRLSEITTIDLTCTYDNETLLKQAIRSHEGSLVKFYLNNLVGKSESNRKAVEDAFMYAISESNYNIVKYFVSYYGDSIVNYTDKINSTLKSILVRFYNPGCSNYETPYISTKRYLGMPHFSAIQTSIEELYKLIPIDLNCTYQNKTFLSASITNYDTLLLIFYLEKYKDHSLLYEKSIKNPFIFAIVESNLQAVHTFLDYFGNHPIPELNELINLGVHFILQHLTEAIRSSERNRRTRSIQSSFVDMLSFLSGIATIDWNWSYQDETFLTIGIRVSDINFINFVLSKMEDLSIFNSPNSPLAYAIRTLNLLATHAFITFFGDQIKAQSAQINLAVQLLITDLTFTNDEITTHIQILKRLSKVVDIDLTFGNQNGDFLTKAIQNNDVEFVKFYLDNLKDKSILAEVSKHSPFVFAIRKLDSEIINLFIDFFGDDIANQTEQINFGLQLILEDLYVDSQKKNDNNMILSIQVTMAAIASIIKQLSKLANIDLSCSYENETFLTFAIRNSDFEFAKFCLDHLKDHSIFQEATPTSPFVSAIREMDLTLVNLFIDFLGDAIVHQTEQINLGLKLLLEVYYQNYIDESHQQTMPTLTIQAWPQMPTVQTNALASFPRISVPFPQEPISTSKKQSELNLVAGAIKKIIKRLTEVTNIDLTCTYHNETFLTLAIKSSDSEFINLFLNHIADHTSLYEDINNSPFVYAIRQVQLDIVNVFIDYFAENINNQLEQINLGLQFILEDLYLRNTSRTLLPSINSNRWLGTSNIRDDLLLIRNLIKRLAEVVDVDLNYTHQDETFVSIAIRNSCIDFIRFYLDDIKDHSLLDEKSASPFTLAIRLLNIDIINVFIDYFGDQIRNQSDQINLALKSILIDLYKLLNPSPASKSNSFISHLKQVKETLLSLRNILKRIYNVPHVKINQIYCNESFLTIAIKQSDVEFVKFYLKTINDPMIFHEKSVNSPLVVAIKQQNVDIVNAFIDYCGDKICECTTSVNLGLKLTLESLIKKGTEKPSDIRDIPTNSSRFSSSLMTILTRLSKIVSIDWNCSYENETFLTYAIKLNDVSFVKFYLENIKDHTLLTNYSAKSPFILAITKLNLNIIELFIFYFGDSISRYTDQLHFGLKLILKDLYNKSDKKHAIDKNMHAFVFDGMISPINQNKSNYSQLTQIQTVLKRFLEIIPIDFDKCSYNNETFLTMAVESSDVDFINFYLTDFKCHSILTKNSPKSPFVLAIKNQNLAILDLFIRYFGDSIQNQIEQINFGLKLLLQDLCDMSSSSSQIANRNGLQSIRSIITRLSDVVPIDLNFSYRNETFLTLAIKYSDIELAQFYLRNMNEHSVRKDDSMKSLLVFAIRTQNLDILNFFINYFGEKIPSNIEHINLGIQFLLQDLYRHSMPAHAPSFAAYKTVEPSHDQNSITKELSQIQTILQRLSEVAPINLNYKYKGHTFLTVAILNSHLDFIKFFLDTIKKYSISSEGTINTAFLQAIRERKLDVVNIFIAFFQDDITKYHKLFDDAFEIILEVLYKAARDVSSMASSQSLSLIEIIKRLSEVTTINWTCSYENETFVTLAVNSSNIDFMHFYLDNMRDQAILTQKTPNSPFVLAIRKYKLEMIDFFLTYLKDSQVQLVDLINYALYLILQDLWFASRDNIHINTSNFLVQNSNVVGQPVNTYLQQIQSLIKQLSESVPGIDLNCKYENETFLSFAVKENDSSFTQLILNIMKSNSLHDDELISSTFVLAIKQQNIRIIDHFIAYFGNDISKQVSNINLGLKFIVENLYTIVKDAKSTEKTSKPSDSLKFLSSTNNDKNTTSVIQQIVSKFIELPNINFNCTYNGISFLSLAIQNSDFCLAKFLLHYLKEHSLFQDIDAISPFSIAIGQYNLEIVNEFIDYYDNKIADQVEQINVGLMLMLQKLYQITIKKSDAYKKMATFSQKSYQASFDSQPTSQMKEVIKRLSEVCDIDFNLVFNDHTFFTLAIIRSDVDFIRFCLDHTKNLILLNEQSIVSPFIHAIKEANLKIVDLFIEFLGDKIQTQSKHIEYGLSLLFESLHTASPTYAHLNDVVRHSAVTIERLNNVCSIDLNRYFGQNTYLTRAVRGNTIQLAKCLIENETVDVNLCELESGNTPLMIAISKGYIELAMLLIECPRIDVNKKNYSNNTALSFAMHRCSQDNYLKLIQILLKKIDQDQLDYAFYLSDDRIASQMIQNPGLNINYEHIQVSNLAYPSSKNGEVSSLEGFRQTCLVYSMRNGYFDKVELILDHPQFDPVKSDAEEAIFISIEKRNFNLFEKLLKFVNVNCFNSKSESLLFYCCKYQFIDGVNAIINNESFDIHQSNFQELLLTVFERYYDDFTIAFDMPTIEALVEYDATHSHLLHFDQLLPNGKSFFTQMKIKSTTPKVLVQPHQLFINKYSPENSDDVYLRFLLENGADPNKPDSFGIYPLQHAILNLSLPLVQGLINAGRIDYSIHNINYEEIVNGTYLHLAAFTSPQIVSALLSQNLDIEAKDDLGNTPLMVATKKKRTKVNKNRTAIINLFKHQAK